MNASFGNAVELILSIIALKENKIEVVKASIIGSILSNLLLVSNGLRARCPRCLKLDLRLDA